MPMHRRTLGALLILLGAMPLCLALLPGPQLLHGGAGLAGRPLETSRVCAVPSARPTARRGVPALRARIAGATVGRGMRAAVFILDDQQRAKLKKSAASQFPLVPPPIIDYAIEEVAKLIKEAAPRDVQALLVPGGLDKRRGELRDKYAKIIAGKIEVPMLDEEGEQKVAAFFIDECFNFLASSEIGDYLKAPIERLKALEARIEDAKLDVHPVTMFLHRVRRHWARALLLTVTIGAYFSLPYLYAEFPGAKKAAVQVVVFMTDAACKLLTLYFRLPIKAK